MWKPRKLPADFKATVESIYDSMAEPAKPAFTDSDLRNIYSIIRLTVDFHNFLENADLTAPDKRDVTFACESIFSGIESFIQVNNSYRILVGSLGSEIKWEFTSLNSLRERFMTMYQELLSGGTFERRCRLLLDLFKLQIVFTGMLFE